ncbi:hypothetical protein Tco_1016446 [Tanacetum coccineum]|uniref:Uncharacterized protein n=1 Tax=Tanacetum coccineum TaxID=301880 RepID=A0ABQ5FNS5_9ASTR
MPVLKPCNSEDDIVKVVDGNATTAFWERCCTKLGAIRLGSRIAGDLAFSKTLDLTMDTVTRLMKEVECEEKAAEQAKAEAESAWSCSDTIAKLNELKRAQLHVVITNEMLASEVNAQKQHLATEMETLQLRVASLLDNGNRSLELLNEMNSALNIRCTTASMKRKLAILKKQEGEASAAAAVAYEEMQMEKLILESKRLKQEAAETSKEFLIDRACAVDMLHGEISDKCKNVKLLKEELDQAIPLSGILSSRQTLSILPYQPQPEQADSDELSKNSSGLRSFDTTEDHIQSVNHKQISRDSKLLGKTSAKHIKNVRTKNKLHGSRGYARSIKKVKIQCKLHEILMLAKRIKKVKRKTKLHGTRMSAKSVKKVKIKTKLHGNRVFGQSNKKMKIEGGVNGTRMSAKSLKKENNGSFEADIKIGPAVAEITEVGQGKSTECSEDTYAEGLALRSTMKKETGQKSKRKRKQVMKCSGWSPAPRRFAFARDPRGYF